MDGWVLPPIVYTVSPPLRGGVAFAPRTLGVTTTPSPTDDARGEASGEGRGWCATCYAYKMPNQMLVKVGSGSSGDTFQLKGAEWADVKAQP